MDAGGHGPSHHLQHLGLREFVRSLPILLRQHARPSAIRHLVDRVHPDLPALCRRHLLRPRPGRGPLSPRPHRRLFHPRVWHLHDLPRHPILASLSRTRRVRGNRQRPLVLSRHLRGVDLLHHHEVACHGHRRSRLRNRRPNLSSSRSTTATEDRLWLDGACAGLHHPVHGIAGHRIHADAPPTPKVRSSSGMGSLQGASLRPLLHRHVSQFHGALLCLLLCK
jgi:hypothetical protein